MNLAKQVTTIRCTIYTGVLQDGTISPGFIARHGSASLPMAWVCPFSTLRNREIEKSLDTVIIRTDEEWAEINVRIIKVEFKGFMFNLDPKEYDIMVTGDFSSATHGFPVKRPNTSIDMDVPDGQTGSQADRANIANRTSPTTDRMRALRNMYTNSAGAPRGLNPGVNEIQTPAPGHLWGGV